MSLSSIKSKPILKEVEKAFLIQFVEISNDGNYLIAIDAEFNLYYNVFPEKAEAEEQKQKQILNLGQNSISSKKEAHYLSKNLFSQDPELAEFQKTLDFSKVHNTNLHIKAAFSSKKKLVLISIYLREMIGEENGKSFLEKLPKRHEDLMFGRIVFACTISEDIFLQPISPRKEKSHGMLGNSRSKTNNLICSFTKSREISISIYEPTSARSYGIICTQARELYVLDLDAAEITVLYKKDDIFVGFPLQLEFFNHEPLLIFSSMEGICISSSDFLKKASRNSVFPGNIDEEEYLERLFTVKTEYFKQGWQVMKSIFIEEEEKVLYLL